MTADQADDRERIARALNVAGWTCSGGYHEPEQYDECAGCQKVCGEMADAVLAALDLLARDNAVAREAWKEGFGAGCEDLLSHVEDPLAPWTLNPYPAPKETPDAR